MKIMEKKIYNSINPEIPRKELKKESLEELSKRAVKIFKERLESSKELDEIKELEIDGKKIEIIWRL